MSFSWSRWSVVSVVPGPLPGRRASVLDGGEDVGSDTGRRGTLRPRTAAKISTVTSAMLFAR